MTVALWQQAGNRAAAAVLGTLPSGWRNSSMPPQRLELDGDTVEYAAARDGSFAVALADTRRIVRAAMQSLPPAQRQVLELAYFGGLTQVEISERTGVEIDLAN